MKKFYLFIICILMLIFVIEIINSLESSGGCSGLSNGNSLLQGNYEIYGNGQLKYIRGDNFNDEQKNLGEAAAFGLSTGSSPITPQQISAAQEYGVKINEQMTGLQISQAKQQVIQTMLKKLTRTDIQNYNNFKKYIEYLQKMQKSNDISKKIGSVEFDNKCGMTFKKGEENKDFIKIPSGAELKTDDKKLIIICKDGNKDSIYEFEGSKITWLKKDAELIYENNKLTLNGGADKVEILILSKDGKSYEKKEFKGIDSGIITFDDKGEIQNIKIFTAEEQKFDIEKSKIIYSPKGKRELNWDIYENKISGKNADFSIDEKKVVDSKEFYVGLDKDGAIDKISIKGGYYNDPFFGPIISKNENKFLDIYYGDIRGNSEIKDGVSLPKDTSNYHVEMEKGVKQNIPQIQLKGNVDIRFNEIGYIGSLNAFSEFGATNNELTVLYSGEGVKLNNGINQVEVSPEGKVSLSRIGLTDIRIGEAFAVKFQDNEWTFYKNGELKVDSSTGKSFVMPYSDYEGSLELKEFRSRMIEQLESNQQELIAQLKDYDKESLTLEQKSEIVRQIVDNARYTKNFESALMDLKSYVTNPSFSDPKIESEVRLAMAELGKGMLASQRFAEIVLPEVKTGKIDPSEQTNPIAEAIANKESLHYKVADVDGVKRIVGWSPDGVRFLDPSVKTVPDDYPTESYRRYSPPERNQKILESLVAGDGSLDILQKAAKDRGVDIERIYGGINTNIGSFSKNSEDFEALQKSYNNAKRLYEDVAYAASKNENTNLYYEAKLGMANADQIYGDFEKAKQEYDQVVKESKNPEIQARAYGGNSLIQAQKGEISEAIKSLDSAQELDLYNVNYKDIQDRLNSEYFNNRGQIAASQINDFWNKYNERISSGYTSTLGATYSIITDTFRELQRMDPDFSRQLFDALQDKSNEAQMQRFGFQAIGTIDTSLQQKFLESDFNVRRQMLYDSIGMQTPFSDNEIASKGLGFTKQNLDTGNYDEFLQKRYEYIRDNYGLKYANTDKILSLITSATDKVDMDKGALDVVYHGDKNAIEKFASKHSSGTFTSYEQLSNLVDINPGVLKESIGEKIIANIMTLDNAALLIAPEIIGSKGTSAYRFSSALEESRTLGQALRLSDEASRASKIGELLRTYSVVAGEGIPEYATIGNIARVVPAEYRPGLAAIESAAIADGQRGIWEVVNSLSSPSIRGMTLEQIQESGIKTRSFFAVTGETTARRLQAGGILEEGSQIISWPTSPERAHLGPGFYSWDNLESARAYKIARESEGIQNLKIVEIRFSEETISRLRQLNIDSLSDKAANQWLERHSYLWADDPTKVIPHNLDFVKRGTNFGVENYFTPAIFQKGAFLGIVK